MDPRGEVVALIGTTIRVYADCLMPNGALVEAPSHLPFYPVDARGTMRCRPGLDAAMAIMAMDALGRDVRTPLLRWLVERAHGFTDDGLLQRAYQVHGGVDDDAPDLLGTALLLFAIAKGGSSVAGSVEERAARGLASALAVRWDGEHERFRELASAHGIFRAAELTAASAAFDAAGATFALPEWSRLAESIGHDRDGSIREGLEAIRSDPQMEPRAEAIVALLSLAWPFDTGSFGNEAARLAEQLMAGRTMPARHSSEEHPPLEITDALQPSELFWLAAGLARAGESDAARHYVRLGLSTADGSGHLAEYADPVDLASSPRPYLLAHLLFLLAIKETGELAEIPRSAYAGRRRS